ncbi:MAG: hypothetical protein M3540_08275, partial [Actinomycetota bacterium]|nr:hypothetical protein [Actinomycetota bacterium]
MRIPALALALLACAVLAPAAHAGPIVDRAVASLGTDPVYVDPEASPTISSQEERQLERLILSTGAGPLYIAILPESAAAEAGGSPEEVLRAIADGV